MADLNTDVAAPEWRRLVDDWAAGTTVDDAEADGPLSYLLWNLHYLALRGEKLDTDDVLARIITVCEAQTGNGWQADPDGSPHTHPGRPHDVRCLLWALNSPRWEVLLGNRAAEWLRDITEADRGGCS